MHTSALRNAVYLFGAYVSGDVHLQSLQDELLGYSLQDLSAALANLEGPAIADVVQTEVILAIYLISCNRYLEGVYHLDGASALLLAGRLHDAQRARQIQPVTDARHGNTDDPQVDVIEGEELARANWAVVALDSCWSSILRRAARLPDATSYVAMAPQATSSTAGIAGGMNVGLLLLQRKPAHCTCFEIVSADWIPARHACNQCHARCVIATARSGSLFVFLCHPDICSICWR